MTIRAKILTFTSFLIAVFTHQIYAQNPETKEILWTADWSPDGKLFAIGGNIGKLKIFSGSNLKPYKSLQLSNTITRVKWHPSKNIIAVATQNSTDKSIVFNLETDEKIELSGISPDGARGIDWNHTGEYLAVADNDGQIFIYNIKGELIRNFANIPNSTKSITAIDWHPKENIFITVSDVICIYSMEGNLIKKIKHRPEDVLLLSVAWHKSGDFFVTGDYGYENVKSLLQYWDKTGVLLKTIDVSKGEYRNLSWSRKGNRLASASDALRIWNAKGELISEGKSADYLWGVSWNKKGNRIITSSTAQSIKLWDDKAEMLLEIE